MSQNQSKIDMAYLDSISNERIVEVQVPEASIFFELESNMINDSAIKISVSHKSCERIIVSNSPIIEVLLVSIEGNIESPSLTVVVRNCPNLKYLQLPEVDSGTKVSIISDKSLSTNEAGHKNKDISLETTVKDNSIPHGLFVNGLISELFVLWRGAKIQSLTKSPLNAVTHDSKLLPAEYENDEQWEREGGIWLYDVTEEFKVEPEIVFANASIMDSAYIGSSLSQFNFDELFVDAVVVDVNARSNPSSRKSHSNPKSMLVEQDWTIPFKVLYLENDPALDICQVARFGQETTYLHLGNAKSLTKVVANNSDASKLDLSMVDSLEAIDACGISFIGISHSKIDKLSLNGGVVQSFYTFDASIDRVICQHINRYFLMGKGRKSELEPDVLAFEFVDSNQSTSRSNSYSIPANNSNKRRNRTVEPVCGYQEAKQAVQAVLLGLRSQDVYSIVPQSGKTLTYLINNYYDKYLRDNKVNGSTPSFSEVMKPYINGAGQAMTPSECQFSVIFLHQVLSYLFDLYAEKVELIPSELVDCIWKARQSSLCFNSDLYTLEENTYIPSLDKCESWTWKFPRNDAENNPKLGIYQDAWLCDLGLIIYTLMLGGDTVRNEAAAWFNKALEKAYAPIQLFTMNAFFGSLDVKKYILRSLYKYLEILKKNGRQGDVEAILQNLRAINQSIGHCIVKSIEAMPLTYSEIKLTLKQDAIQGGAPSISNISIEDVSLNAIMSSREASYYLMRFSQPNDIVSPYSYAFRFNSFMIEEFLNIFRYGKINDKYWTKEFKDTTTRDDILSAFVDYLKKLPVDFHAYINAESIVSLLPKISLDALEIPSRAIAQGYADYQISALIQKASPSLDGEDEEFFKHDDGARYKERLADIIMQH